MGTPTSPSTLDARARLLRAAELLFAARGYAGTSVHEITDAAGVNRALLYYYFEDKHSLYAAVIDEGVAEFRAMLERSLDGPGEYPERLRAFVEGHLDLIRRRGDMARVVHRCLLDGHQEEFGLTEKFAVAVARLEAFFAEGAAVGAFRPLHPGITARSFLGPTFVFSLWRAYEGDRFPLQEIADEITGQLLHGLLPP